MTRKELYQKYLDALGERYELENKINSFVEKWEKGETNLRTDLVQEVVDKGYERLETLKQLEQRLRQEANSMNESEQAKKIADISLRAKLGEAPSNVNIIGGVLSSNAEDSHLIGTEKTSEQLEQEKNQMLASIKSRVASGELTLAEASKLVSDVHTSYGFYDKQTSDIEKSSGIHM